MQIHASVAVPEGSHDEVYLQLLLRCNYLYAIVLLLLLLLLAAINTVK
jgi:hypothetical protein